MHGLRVTILFLASLLMVPLVAVAALPLDAASDHAKPQETGLVTLTIVGPGAAAAYVTPVASMDAGMTLLIINEGDAKHTATDEGGAWTTPVIDAGGFAMLVLDEPGTYVYGCTLHPDTMLGVLVVE